MYTVVYGVSSLAGSALTTVRWAFHRYVVFSDWDRCLGIGLFGLYVLLMEVIVLWGKCWYGVV